MPADDIACTMALPRPRFLLSQTSLSSTMPAPHSPPTPMPVMMRKVSSEAKSHAAADSIEPMASRSSVHSSAFLRPILSPSQPNSDAAEHRGGERHADDQAGLRQA